MQERTKNEVFGHFIEFGWVPQIEFGWLKLFVIVHCISGTLAFCSLFYVHFIHAIYYRGTVKSFNNLMEFRTK